MAAVEAICSGLDHAEAVVWDARRAVLFCGGEAGQLYAVALDGGVEVVAETGGSLLGLALDEAGTLYACDTGRGRVLAIDPDRGEWFALPTDLPGRELVAPNGIALGPAGDVYFTDSGNWGRCDGAIVRAAAGAPAELWSTAVPAYPNGCLVRDGSLLVVESERHRVVAVPIGADGSAGRPAEVLRLEPSVPDQLAFDSEGGMVVGCYRPDVVFHASAGGAVTSLAEDPSGIEIACPTGCAFAGPDLDVLVVTSYGAQQLLRVDCDLVGEQVPRPARGGEPD